MIRRKMENRWKNNSGLEHYWGNLHEIRYFCLTNLSSKTTFNNDL